MTAKIIMIKSKATAKKSPRTSVKKSGQKFIIPEGAVKTRLDIALTDLAGISRSQIQKLIDQRLVLINNMLATKHGQPLRAGDTVVIASETSPQPSPLRRRGGVNSLLKNKPTIKKLEPEIIFKNSEFVILNKPSGLLVHPTQANETNTLASWLIKKFPKIKTVGDPAPEPLRGPVRGKLSSSTNIRPGIVHRLDREASGLMVVALTQKSFENLKNQFKNREITKEYLALVHGKVERDWEHLRFPIARGENNDRMAALPVTPYIPQGAKEAHTEYITEKVFANCTLVRVFLHTGRMHQIRVHFLAYNHPLVGDSLYFQKKRKKNLDEKCGRLFLHSTKLGFTDLAGKKQEFESSLPKNLNEFIKNLN
ncbi:MAG: RluA family pseudouridine synthase [Candidatus Magasanikbacteria bacterium]|nr:RluA family pseudouridine synthase [Candidatus Magasanikbacteria bacterium]